MTGAINFREIYEDVDDIEDPDQDDTDQDSPEDWAAKNRRLLAQRPDMVRLLGPAVRYTLETGRVPRETPAAQEPPGVPFPAPEATKAPVEPSSQSQSPAGPWRSSVQFVEESMQEIQWLIPEVLPAGTIVLLSGREGTMKSFLALSMAYAVATGAPWLGRPTTQGRVLYLDGEMPPALLRDRLRGIGVSESLNVWSWDDETFPYELGNSELRRASQEHSLIVVDTLRRHMDGLKENSADDMARVTKGLR